MNVKRWSRSTWIAIALLLGIAVPGAHASTISFSDSIPITDTDWSSSVSIPQFNPHLGVLQSVDISLTGTIDSSITVENTSKRARTISVTLTDNLALTGPTASTSLALTSNISTSDALTAFDTHKDFLGTDSASHPGLTNTVSNSSSTSAPADLALFTGFGNIVMPVNAGGSSLVSAASNVRTDLVNQSGVTVDVTYSYRVPEPGTVMMLGSALLLVAGLGFTQSRREFEQ